MREQQTTPRQTYPPPADLIVLRGSSRWIVGAAVGMVVLVASYLLAVWTRTGQAVENAALRGADRADAQDVAAADESLHAITLVSLGVAIVVVAAIALIRRRLDLAVAAVGVIVAGQVLTQGLKRYLLPRPELVRVVGDYTHNSFPSGHTTIAMTVLFSLFLVVPYRWRGVMMFFVWPWAVSIGVFTITAKWHRLSDTIGARAVALICACVASWWLARRGRVAPSPARRFPARVVLVVFIAASTAASLVTGAIIWGTGFRRGVDFAVPDEVWDYNAYLGATVLSAAFSGLATLLFWWLWHRRQIL